MNTVNVRVRTFSVAYLPLVVDSIDITGAITGSASVLSANILIAPVRVLDSTTVTVQMAGMTTYSQVFNTYYGQDGNLEDIVIDVIMVTNAQATTFISNGYCYPVSRVKTNNPAGDEYFLFCTANVGALMTFDWQYPAPTTISAAQSFSFQYGAVGLKSVVLDIDISGTLCTSNYNFILQNLTVNVCYGQEFLAVLDEFNSEICATPDCADPYDLGEGNDVCCDIQFVRKLKYYNWDDFSILVQGTTPGISPCEDATFVSGSGVVELNYSTTTLVPTLTEYIIPFNIDTNLECSCGVKASTIHVVVSQDGGIDSCCELTFNTTIDIEVRTISLSQSTVNLLGAVGDCINGVVTITASGCAGLSLPIINNGLTGGCLELGVPITADYDAAQLAALIALNGSAYLNPGDFIDINFEYCPIQVESGCCDMTTLIAGIAPDLLCNEETIQVCYSAIQPPDCTENLHLCCDDIKFTIPGSAALIKDETQVLCFIPATNIRIQGNAFFPPIGICTDYNITITAENIATGDMITPIVLDAGTFVYTDDPVWSSLLQFATAGIWNITVTANWCDTVKVCELTITVCYDITVTRLACHKHRIAVSSTVVQDITILIEDVYSDYSNTVTYNTAVSDYYDVILPADGSYRITVTTGVDDLQKIFYIHEICSLAECYREMVLKIMCNQADPCCINCDKAEIENQKRLRYMTTQMMALFLSLIALIHKDYVSYLGVWQDDECRTASSSEIAKLIEELKASVQRCGVCSDSIASIVTPASGCQNC